MAAQKYFLVRYIVPYFDENHRTCYNDGRVLVVRSSSPQRVLARLAPLLPPIDEQVVRAMAREGRGDRREPLSYFTMDISELRPCHGFLSISKEKLRYYCR